MLPGGAPEIVCSPEEEGGGQGLLRQTSLPRMPAEGCCSGVQDAGAVCYACCDSLCNVALHQILRSSAQVALFVARQLLMFLVSGQWDTRLQSHQRC